MLDATDEEDDIIARMNQDNMGDEGPWIAEIEAE